MVFDFPTPTDIGDQYLDILKSLKPEVDTARKDSDWWVRSRVNGGVVSGVYADQRKIADDAFPQSARREAMERHLFTYFGSGFRLATEAHGNIAVTGVDASVLPAGTELVYTPNGNSYVTTEELILDGASGVVAVVSVAAGQEQNLLENAPLTISSPPAGFESGAVVYGGNIADGRNLETTEEAAARVLERIQNPLAGGTESDYKQFAQDADATVIEANVIRFIYGLGTVGLVVTAGTTDIDDALDNGDAVVKTPSLALLAKVQTYIDAVKPLTDNAYVLAPAPLSVDVTVKVRYAEGDGTTIPSGQTLTQEELVQREVKRAIYKTPPGGRKFGASGFVVASEIEEVIDSSLSSTPYTEGSYAQILKDRQVEDLSLTGANLMIAKTEMAEPGTITIVEF